MFSCSGSAVVKQSTHHPKAKGSKLATSVVQREKLSQQYMKESDMFSCSGSAVVKQSTHFPRFEGPIQVELNFDGLKSSQKLLALKGCSHVRFEG
jgi:hypothetical protein